MEFINNIKDCWKMWSVRIYTLIIIAPDLYNLCASYNLLEGAPDEFVWTIRILAFAGLVSRLIKQEKLHANTGNNDTEKLQ